MNITLKQVEGLLKYRKYEITPNALLVDFRTDEDRYSQEMSWQFVGFDEEVVAREWDLWMGLKVGIAVISMLFMVYSFVMIATLKTHSLWFYFFWGPLTLLVLGFVFEYVRKRDKFKMLKGGREIKFRYHESDKKEVDEFIEHMKVAHGVFLRKAIREAALKEKNV